MKTDRPFLLDTNVLLALIRGKALGRYIDVTHRLRDRLNRHLVCVVSHGEIWTLADQNGWGDEKCDALRVMLDNLVTVDISSQAVIDAYVEVVRAARSSPGGSQTNRGENDFWIAAATRASDAILLTTDHDFDPMHPKVIQRFFIDPKSHLVGES